MTRRGKFDIPKTCSAVELADGRVTSRTRHIRTLREDASVLLRISLMGLCRSDVKEAAGQRPVRSDFGHELVGQIVEQQGMAGLPAGTQVCLDPHVPIHRTMGFSEWFVAWADSDALHRAFIPLPDQLPPEHAIFCEPLACASHSMTCLLRSFGRPTLDGKNVAVVGAGVAGALFGLLGCHHGAGSLTFVNRGIKRLHFLRDSHIFPSASFELSSSALQSHFDVVILATARITAADLRLGCEVVNDGGLLFLYGGTDRKTLRLCDSVDLDAVRRQGKSETIEVKSKRLVVAGAHGAVRADFEMASRLLSADETFGAIYRLISRRLSLAQLPEFLHGAAAGTTHWCGKVVVEV